MRAGRKWMVGLVQTSVLLKMSHRSMQSNINWDPHSMRGEKHTEKGGKKESLNTLIVNCGQLGRHLIKRQDDRRLGLH